MWITLLVMAVAVSLEPFRVGMTVLMINRPRPGLQLLAFLAGGFAMGTTVGVTVLFVLRPALGSAHFNLPKVQIVVGAVVLVNAALLATGLIGGQRGNGPAGRVNRIPGRLATRIRALRGGRSLWAAGVAGLGIALPSVDYVAALALIVASGAAAAIQFGALMLFNVVAFALVEVPLVCYLLAPDRTRATLSALHDWLRFRGRRGVAALLAAIGCVLLGVGFAGL
ncbi:GAP family protein [Mycobacterium deserti]|uniref:GAP family protein n=1 Tax=Mycobacterium deserti TaxID=2978347 RepID=A0ABT2M9A5_9MYCO|nr:GAP family protein [Mycobacterium deserti]MCT7658836.1 GAP family protein [Mycobacterium deserti]